MSTSPKDQIELPQWLSEAIEEGEPTDGLPNKRSETRLVSHRLMLARPEDDPTAKPFTVKLWNVSSKGLGFIARTQVPKGQRLSLIADGGPADPVHVCVVHCTRTVQGYLVGCTFEQR